MTPSAKRMSVLYRFFLCVALFAAAACASSSSQVYRDPNMDIGSIYTVAVMPFVNLTKDQLASDRVRDVFMTMMLADGRVYTVPTGEIARQVSLAGIANPFAPTPINAAMRAAASSSTRWRCP